MGADVTFDGVTLSFDSPIRNAIMANGYTLTLNNVSRVSGAREVHLLCGGLTGQLAFADSLPPEGPNGRIVIQGNTSLGNIYAGSLFGDGSPNCFNGNSEIIIEKGASGQMGEVYASGAIQAPPFLIGM